MTSTNLRPASDIIQAEHENDAKALRGLAIGKTTGGDFVELLLNSDGGLI